MSPGKPGDIYSILNEKSDNMAFELLVESAIDDVDPEQVYQELFLTTSRNAKKRLRRWSEAVEDVLKDITVPDLASRYKSRIIKSDLLPELMRLHTIMH